MTVIIDRATLRGELPPGTDAAGVIQTVTALIYYRLFIGGEPASEQVADGAAATGRYRKGLGNHAHPRSRRGAGVIFFGQNAATSATAWAKACGASWGRLCPMPPSIVRCSYLPENLPA